MDLGAVGAKFTWKGPIYQGSHTFEWLDRALGDDQWRLDFSKAIVKVLPRMAFSDHHSTLVCPYGVGRNKGGRILDLEVCGWWISRIGMSFMIVGMMARIYRILLNIWKLPWQIGRMTLFLELLIKKEHWLEG